MSTQQIVIVGAGILGLTTAQTISEKLNELGFKHEITIIAQYGPHNLEMNDSLTTYNEYVSPWAGAHFRPFPITTKEQKEEMKMTRQTLKYFKYLSENYKECSIKFIKGVEFIENPNEYYQDYAKYGYSEGLENFEKLETKPGILGFQYDTWVLNPTLYLQYIYFKLLLEFKIKFISKKLNSLSEINSIIQGNPIIINCSGNGLKYNGGVDPDSFPIRGQTLLLNPGPNYKSDKTVTIQLKDGSWVFTIPRPYNGGVILGGTKQINDTSLEVRDEDTKYLEKLGSIYFPELQKINAETNKPYFDIIRINVALRPGRKGGLNNSIEKFNDNKQFVINNYGAGGMGYELSYGSSLKTFENLLSILKIDNKSKL
ncbi:uncharacterized protein KGF55_000994 [Candida pseudojiufengensis]|uniref:uncharacterized protein n=1 Tax=Candida pseudojiufengensis TaxID=497109 RepID=UPI002225A050|nr:uncharacterized protein KGF55_000994 [Candida pseudojiufengensis]KAI5965632.1 hypothetical protein KGF55_000994 [Candida pseudojiufengensis]